MNSFETFQFKRESEVGYLTLNRPKALNALNKKVLEELRDFLTSVNPKEIKALVVQGAGDKAFVAGADIKEMLAFDSKKGQAFSQEGQKVFSLIESLPVPVIALIQGFALGGGLELALACDILIMDVKAQVGLPEVSLSLLPAFGGTQRLSRSVGLYKAKEMIFTGRFYTAQEALDMGLANVVVSGSLKDEAHKIIEFIKKRSPVAIKKCKELIHKSRDIPLKEGLELEAKEFGQLFNHEDSQEGLKAFVEKRPPQFKGLQ